MGYRAVTDTITVGAAPYECKAPLKPCHVVMLCLPIIVRDIAVFSPHYSIKIRAWCWLVNWLRSDQFQLLPDPHRNQTDKCEKKLPRSQSNCQLGFDSLQGCMFRWALLYGVHLFHQKWETHNMTWRVWIWSENWWMRVGVWGYVQRSTTSLHGFCSSHHRFSQNKIKVTNTISPMWLEYSKKNVVIC